MRSMRSELRAKRLPFNRERAIMVPSLETVPDCRADTSVVGVLVHSSARTAPALAVRRSEEHTSELQSLMRISYAVFCLKKKITQPVRPQISTRQACKNETTSIRCE